MAISAISTQTSQQAANLARLRSDLETLQQQLSDGVKASTYGGLGVKRNLAVDLKQSLAGIDAFDGNITTVNTRIQLMSQSLTEFSSLGQQVKRTASPGANSGTFGAAGQTAAQTTALAQFSQMCDLLNTRIGDRYLFSGLAGDTAASAGADMVLDGDGTRAGFRQVVDERRQADLGTDGLGRLALSDAAGVVTLARDGNHPFGFTIGNLTTDIAGATVTQAAGSPPTASIDLSAATPTEGQSVNVTLNMPDGTSTTLSLTATASSPAGEGQFTIGATAADTAANLDAALGTAIEKLGATSLVAASAMAASNDFFNIDSTHPPQRVDGPPFDTATALIDGTSADTVSWYTGESGSTGDRATMTARIDEGLTVKYGVRANEDAIRRQLQGVAVFAVMHFDAADPNAAQAYNELGSRVANALDDKPGTPQMATIQAELAGVQTATKATSDRHTQRKSVLDDMLQSIVGVDEQEVGISILTLQTRLSASLQTTALISKISMVNYL